MTARMHNNPVLILAQFGNAEVRRRHMEAGAHMGKQFPTTEATARAAEQRVWGRAKLTGADKERPRQVLAIGFTNGPVGRTNRVIADGLNPRVFN